MILLDVPFAEKETAKSLGARWNPAKKKWYVPDDLAEEADKFNRWRANADNSTPASTQSITQSPLAKNAIPANDKQIGVPLSHLMTQVQQAIRFSITDYIWTIAEVANLNERRGHIYFELAETLDDGQQVANCRAMIWQSNTRILEKFTTETGSELTIGQKILLLVEPTFHEKFGFSLVIQDIDPSYTLGELEAKVQAVRKQLIKEELYQKNKQYKLPKDFLRLAVIAPPTAAGLGDFRIDADLLAERKLCEFKYFYSAFQGDKVETEMQGAFGVFNAMHESNPFDALIIIRGGGAKLDLQPLNSYPIAKMIAETNLPVITGIGHERDKTILDEVSAISYDTPSKVINAIMTTIFSAAQKAKQDWFYIEKSSQIHLQTQKHLINQLNQTINQTSQANIQKQRQKLLPLMMQVEQQCKLVINNQKNQVKQLDSTIKLQVTSVLKQQKEQLNHSFNLIQNSPENILSRAKNQLKQTIGFILSSGVNTQLNRGFAIITDQQDNPLTTCQQAQQQQHIKIQFKDGTINAKIKD